MMGDVTPPPPKKKSLSDDEEHFTLFPKYVYLQTVFILSLAIIFYNYMHRANDILGLASNLIFHFILDKTIKVLSI